MLSCVRNRSAISHLLPRTMSARRHLMRFASIMIGVCVVPFRSAVQLLPLLETKRIVWVGPPAGPSGKA